MSENVTHRSPTQEPPKGRGVRQLKLADQAPQCEMLVNEPAYSLEALVEPSMTVVDVGCGHGRTRAVVEQAGAFWVGIEPFIGGEHTAAGSAHHLPFRSGSVDIVIADSVLEHIPDVGLAFAEIARVLKTGGVFVGYAAFMECFHEISYSHLSFRGIEFYANDHGLVLETIAGGRRFGIDYHLAVLAHPVPLTWLRPAVAAGMRGVFRTKSIVARYGLMKRRGLSHADASELANLYYRVECLRQSNGFDFVCRKPI